MLCWASLKWGIYSLWSGIVSSLASIFHVGFQTDALTCIMCEVCHSIQFPEMLVKHSCTPLKQVKENAASISLLGLIPKIWWYFCMVGNFQLYFANRQHCTANKALEPHLCATCIAWQCHCIMLPAHLSLEILLRVDEKSYAHYMLWCE